MRLLLLILLAVAGFAGEVRVDATCLWEDKDGYTPVTVRVEALIRPVEVTLQVSLGDSRAYDAVRAEPGQVVSRTVLVPSHSGWGAPTLRWSSPGSAGETGVSVTIDHREVLLGLVDPKESIPLPALNTLLAAQVTNGGSARGSYRGGSGDRAKRLPPADLPDRWQGWPAWLTLLTTPAGEAELSAAQRQAIADWTRCGGALFVTSPGSVEAWRRLGARCTLVDAKDAEQKVLLARLRDAAGEEARPSENPVPGTEELPTGWFLTIAITFAVIAGPLNLLWVRRRGKPWLLLVSTPLISLATCVLLITVGLLADGLARRRSAVQLTLIDVAAQRAVSFTGMTWFCGIAPGAIRLDPEDRLLPNDEEDWQQGWRRSRPALTLDWRGGQTADAAWIPARVNRQLACTSLRPERRRLAISRAGAVWRLSNGLDRTIRELHWTDPTGRSWQIRNLAPGAEADMQSPQRAVTQPSDVLARLGLDARLAAHDMGRTPGTFIAELDGPLYPIPGPTAEDAVPVVGWACGWLAPAGSQSDVEPAGGTALPTPVPAAPQAETF
jgi:hypothetical protein